MATGAGGLKFENFALSVLNSVCPMTMNTLFLSCLVALFVCSLGMAESPLKLELLGPKEPVTLSKADLVKLDPGAKGPVVGITLRYRITNTNDKRLPAGYHLLPQRSDGLTQKIILPARHVGLSPQARLKDIERDDRPGRKRRGERGMILQPQIALKPDYIHNRSLFVRRRS